jgi:Trypsin-like peptidase domain/NB-ARC domain
VPRAAREGFIVRILISDSDRPAGIGFVVGERHIVTCAHVVNTALGRRDQREQERPDAGAQIRVDWPMLTGRAATADAGVRTCWLAAWVPPPVVGQSGGDVAGLVLAEGTLPQGAGTSRMASAAQPGLAGAVFGYPLQRPKGSWAAVVVRGTVEAGELQLDADADSAIRTQPGYSGSPVIVRDAFGDAVIGMLATAGKAADVRDSYAIPSSQIADAWPDLLGADALSARLYAPDDHPGGQRSEIASGGSHAGPAEARGRGPLEAALEAAKFLMAVDDMARGIAAYGFMLDLLVSSTASDGAHGEAEVQQFRDQLSDRGLDPRVLVRRSAMHAEALRRWGAPLTWQLPADPAAALQSMLADFRITLARELSDEAFGGIHPSTRQLLVAALQGDDSPLVCAFVRALEARLPPLRSISREAVLWGSAPEARASEQGEDSGPRIDQSPGPDYYHRIALEAVAAEMCKLPAVDSSFTGRAALVATIIADIRQAMAANGKCVAFLSGQPGAGSSTVAKAAARELLSDFPGGACYVDLHGLVPGAHRDAPTVVRLVSEALRLDLGSAAMDDEQLFTSFAARLAGSQVLLVLDNAKDAAHVAPIVKAAETCCVIVTSRDRRQHYARPPLVFPVPPLDREAAVDLLAQFAGDRGHEREHLDTLARLCGDLPLALRLVGDHMASLPEEDLGYLAYILDAEVTRLDYLDIGERGMRAAIKLSYDNLGADARQACLFVSAAPGSRITGPELAYCLGESPFRQELLLNRLVDRSLAEHQVVRPTSSRPLATFALFELVRIFAKERLSIEVAENDVLAFQHRAVGYLRDRLREITADRSHAELSGELDPARFHAAESLAEEHDWSDLAADLLMDLHILYTSHKEIDSMSTVDNARMRLYLRIENFEQAAIVCLVSAKTFRDMHLPGKASAAAREARMIAGAHALPVQEAEASFTLSLIHADQEDWMAAFNASEQAFLTLTSHHHEAVAIPAAINCAKIAHDHRSLDDDLRWGRIAEDLTERLGSVSDRAQASFALQRAELRAGNYLMAITLARKAADSYTAANDPWNTAVAYENGAIAARHAGDMATAVELYSAAADHWKSQSSDDAAGRHVECLMYLSSVQAEADALEQALGTLGRATDVARSRPRAVPALMRQELALRREATNLLLHGEPPPSSQELSFTASAPGKEPPEGEQDDPELQRIQLALRQSNVGTLAASTRMLLASFIAAEVRNRTKPSKFHLNEEFTNPGKPLGAISS